MTNRGKRWHSGVSGIAITVAAGALVCSAPAFAQVTGGQVVGGQATIAGQGTSQTTITQTSDRAILNWDRFSLGAGDVAVFQQPDARSITVNRVIGGDPSAIMGSIKANGQVVLINRNGVLFGKGSQVDTAGLIVSTHDIDATGFLRGDSLLRFTDGGNDKAEVVVEGRITIRDAGMAAFVAPHVRNSGLIQADMGRVTLAAGKGFGIDLYGDGLVRFAASDAITGTLKDAQGQPVKALVENDGTIAARGGKILLTATAAREVVNASVNVAGIVRADAVSSQGGVITLSGSGGITTEARSVITAAGATGGSVTVAGGAVGLGGAIDASSTGAHQTGGSVAVRSDSLLSLGGSVTATSALGSGGSVTYQAARLFENSDGRTDVSGLIDGGTIRSIITDTAMTSGRYAADGLYGLGGRIDMTATDLRLLSADVTATGRGGGGLVRIGGAFQGGKTPDTAQPYYESFVGRWGDLPALATAGHAFVNDGTRIDVRASKGQGGTAVVWSDAQTTFMGAIDARGSGAKGSGGAVELSSAQDLRHVALDRVATGGGNLLLDPKNIIIGDAAQAQSWAYQGIIGKWYALPGIAQLETNDRFGAAVALNSDATVMAVGAPGDSGSLNQSTNAGAVYLFGFTDTSFGGAALKGIIGVGYTGGTNYDMAQSLDPNDEFGSAVALNGSATALYVGAPGDDGRGYSDATASAANKDRGAVYKFNVGSNANITPAYLWGGSNYGGNYNGFTSSNVVDGSSNPLLNAGDAFGSAVAIFNDGKVMAVGAPKTDYVDADDSTNNATDVGAVYTWSGMDSGAGSLTGYIDRANFPLTYTRPSLTSGTAFGGAVALSGDGKILAIGAPHYTSLTPASVNNSGAVFLIKSSDATYSAATGAPTFGSFVAAIPQIENVAGKYARLDVKFRDGGQVGAAVALNAAGNKLFIGAPGLGDPAATGSGSGRAYLVNVRPDLQLTDLEGGTTVSGTAAWIGRGNSNGSGNDGNRLDLQDLNFADSISGYTGSNFGAALALSGDGLRLAVGTPGDKGALADASGSGAVRLFTLSWSDFGRYSGGITQAGTIGRGYNRALPALEGLRGIGGLTGFLDADDNFGRGVALSRDGKAMAIGAHHDSGPLNATSHTGAVYLFTFADTNFGGSALQGIIGKGYTGGKNVNVAALDANDEFGTSLALNTDGTRLAVGAPFDDGPGAAGSNDYGAVYLFTFTDTNFSGGALAATVGSNYSGGNNLGGPSPYRTSDWFGSAVALNGTGNQLAVGAYQYDGINNNRTNAGAVYLYNFGEASGAFTGGSLAKTITVDGDLDPTGGVGAALGAGVALSSDGSFLAIGAVANGGYNGSLSGGNAGAIYTYSFGANFTTPTKKGTIGYNFGTDGARGTSVTGMTGGGWFGQSVAVNATGTVMAVGAPFTKSASGTTTTGAVFLFTKSGSSTGPEWTQTGILGAGYTSTGSLDVDGLEANDTFGTSVALNGTGDRMVVGAPTDNGAGNALTGSGAAYLFSFTDAAFSGPTRSAVYGKYYDANSAVASSTDNFGSSVALNASATRMAVGAVGDDGFSNGYTDAGAVYLFGFSDGGFNGGTLRGIIGKGYTGGRNFDVSALEASDNFGSGVALSAAGNLLAVGASGDDGSGNASSTNKDYGAVYLFSFSDNDFSNAMQRGVIGSGYTIAVAGLDIGDRFGSSVAFNAAADRLAIGAPLEDGSGAGSTSADYGAVYLFGFDQSDLTTPFKTPSLLATIGSGYGGSGSAGNNLGIGVTGAVAGAQFGTGVALNATGDRLAVGAPIETGASLLQTGAAYLFGFTSATDFSGASLIGKLGNGEAGANKVTLSQYDRFATSVALDATGDRLAVGAPTRTGETTGGAVYLFRFDGTSAFHGVTLNATAGRIVGSTPNIPIVGGTARNSFGSAVALSADATRLAVGAVNDVDATGNSFGSGTVCLFTFADNKFAGGAQAGTIGKGYNDKNIDIGGLLDQGDRFGSSVALNADATRMAVGAPDDSGVANDQASTGAVYLFSFADASFSGGVLQGIIGRGYTGGKNVSLTAPDGGDAFGTGVALNGAGDRLAVGAQGDDGAGISPGTADNNYGAVYLFGFSDTNFSGGTLKARLGKGYTGSGYAGSLAADRDISTLRAGENFGGSVSLNAQGNLLAVGAPQNKGSDGTGTSLGAVYLFSFTSTNGATGFSGGTKWSTVGKGYGGIDNNVEVSTLGPSYKFGSSVALNAAGDRLAVGVTGDDGQGNTTGDYGAAYLYSFDNSVSTNLFKSGSLTAKLGLGYAPTASALKDVSIDGLQSNGGFGTSLSLNAQGNRLAVGAPTFNGADGSGNSLSQTGAVYVIDFIDGNFSGGSIQAQLGKGLSGGNTLNVPALEASDGSVRRSR
ncbi:MAG: filamentous hemagglutinin N-terminal domain-containing protein [Sphingomonas phyllosphaerae]